MAADDDAYEVGYKRPPKDAQFRPGQSGNPRGRPKNKPSLRADLARELAERTKIVEAGRQRLVSKQRAIVKAMVAAALTGDVRAATAVMNFSTRLLGDDTEEKERPPGSLSSGDDALIEAFLAREASRRSTDGDGTPETMGQTKSENGDDRSE